MLLHPLYRNRIALWVAEARDEARRERVWHLGASQPLPASQVLSDAPVVKKNTPDGIFHPSCLSHGVRNSVQISGQAWLRVLGDWYWGHGKLTQYHRLVESCPAADAGQPCNPDPDCAPSEGGTCKARLAADGCLDEPTAWRCKKCAAAHEADLEKAGCTNATVGQLCGAH